MCLSAYIYIYCKGLNITLLHAYKGIYIYMLLRVTCYLAKFNIDQIAPIHETDDVWETGIAILTPWLPPSPSYLCLVFSFLSEPEATTIKR